MTRRAILHFVYNVDATPTALLFDFVHRIVDPATYPCRLCDLTYGRFVKKASWRRFVGELPVDSRFHLRGGFRRKFPAHAAETLPAVFVEKSPGDLDVLISAKELARIADLDALEALVKRRATTSSSSGRKKKVARKR